LFRSEAIMADGAAHHLDTHPAVPLSETHGRRLWARCRCGREAEVDPAGWLAQGLGGVPLQRLEDRLRCLCGSRSVALEARGDLPAPTARKGIYIFR
jgi:hypothetical protein